MKDLDSLNLRQLQLECARVLSVIDATNTTLSKFNKQVVHDSQSWYKEIIKWYINEYGDFPSKTGPAFQVKLLME